jgi:hypothetical protein
MSRHTIEQLEEAVGMPKTGEMSPLLGWVLLNRLRGAATGTAGFQKNSEVA